MLTVQEVFEKQGFLIIATQEDRKLGDILPFAKEGYPNVGTIIRRIEGPMIVVGFASFDDWIKQHVDAGRPGPFVDRWKHYLKVVAE